MCLLTSLYSSNKFENGSIVVGQILFFLKKKKTHLKRSGVWFGFVVGEFRMCLGPKIVPSLHSYNLSGMTHVFSIVNFQFHQKTKKNCQFLVVLRPHSIGCSRVFMVTIYLFIL